MLNNLAVPFQIGSREINYPLGRYLPPLKPGTFAAWLHEHIPPGGWLLDPFGAHPGLAIEAAQAGYRVIIASNNPILSLMLEVLAAAPNPDQFQAAISELASARRGSERLENIVLSIYATPCPTCGRIGQAPGYLWHPGEEQPYARLVHCKTCGTEGDFPLDALDIEHLHLPGSTALSQARAIERITLGDDESRETIAKALEVYPARPLYVLSTLINKAESLDISAQAQKLLSALLISACDECNTLWPWPNSRLRPRQLTVPPQYRENNPWLALENAVSLWCSANPRPVPLARWPELPPEGGGISLFPGRVRSLFPLPPDVKIAGVIALMPRPNQAFWTLSAIWSGWLWGREAVLPLKGALERRRYDWTWHLGALHHTFAALNQGLPEDVPFFAALPEVNAGFLSAALGAGQTAGLKLAGYALRRDPEEAQVTWHTQRAAAKPPESSPNEVVRAAMSAHLLARGEPAAYLQLYAAAWIELCLNGHIPSGIEQPPADMILQNQTIIHKVLGDARSFQRVDTQATGIESGWWDFNEPPPAEMPLADQIEVELVRFLRKRTAVPQAEIEAGMCARFPGLLTPPQDLLLACLQSYAQLEPGEPLRWTLQEQEDAMLRFKHIQAAHRYLIQIGEQLGYTCLTPTPQSSGESHVPISLLWQAGGQNIWAFSIMASSLISRCLVHPLPAPNQVIVLPGGRANLLSFKLRRDARLARAAQGWHFLKFRHLRQILEQPNLTPGLWDSLLDADPPRWEEAAQLKFF